MDNAEKLLDSLHAKVDAPARLKLKRWMRRSTRALKNTSSTRSTRRLSWPPLLFCASSSARNSPDARPKHDGMELVSVYLRFCRRHRRLRRRLGA